ncbi:prepilin-type N-terminal cleavage/methylation domain-containing protein [Sporosarcina ureae]|uniref:type IV pilus modification PilV family protein n=1 Tax=Sporosarcina ureae TaxID=1571 RepID=UPI0026F1BEEA|nr:prepilin-type N-terminal cleavage/methylation domain-containing protein [Sporosarcina ureae]
MKWKNERGFTLVEILASLTILGIVFISFMTIFSQMNLFNAHTESKLETIHLAKKELNFWRENPLPLEDSDGFLDLRKDEISSPGFIIYKYTRQEKPKYEYQVKLRIDSDLKPFIESSVKLYRFHISIYENNREVSETFGYMEDGTL